MPETLPSQELADRLEALIRVMDPVRSAPPASVHQSWDQLCAGLDTLLSEGASPGPYREEAAALAELVQHGQPSRELSALRSRREEIQQLYFGLCQRIREETGEERRPLRPSNLRRSLTHVLSGVGAVLLVQHLLTPTGCILTAGAFAVFGWGCEFFRRRSEAVNRALMAFFGPVAHAHESEQVNSATWYATALTILAIFGTKDVIILALITLAIGDPVAGWIGRRWGRKGGGRRPERGGGQGGARKGKCGPWRRFKGAGKRHPGRC